MASTLVQTSSNPFTETRDRRKTQAAPKKEIWSTLLNSVSSGKRLPEKQILLLGGQPQIQKEFVESLSTETVGSRRQQSRKPAPVANQYALGYTYQDVLDADHEELLARLSIYTLSNSSAAFAPLLESLLTPRTLGDTLVVILLDWSEPWHWIRQLRDWVRLLRRVVVALDDESKHTMEDNISHWRDRKRSNTIDSVVSETEALPLGPGEWDEPLGVPLCVVCQNTDKMQQLERENGWKDEQFDFIGQYVRTILLKHGGSLIYTKSSAPGPLETLIHSSLAIQPTLHKKELNYEVSIRDKTLIPSNWDSWTKIRLMSENFDPEPVSKSWSRDILNSEEQTEQVNGGEPDAVQAYEIEITNPKADAMMPGTVPHITSGIEVESRDVQSFLSEQAKILEEYQTSDSKERMAQEKKERPRNDDNRHIEEHIGPVQFNMGGIQVDADDMLKKLQDREATRATESSAKSPSTPKEQNAELENQRLKDFFANLAKKPGGSATNSPRSKS